MKPLEGRHAVVTGGSRGIGKACAVALVASGATVTVTGRSESALSELVAKGGAHSYFVADAVDADAMREGFKRAAAKCGPVDILVANVGGVESGRFLQLDDAHFHRIFELNLMTTLRAVRCVLEGMTIRGFGRIVTISSTAGLKGYAYGTAYCAAKHAIIGFVRALALEVATKGVTVNAICPGFTDTDLLRESLKSVVNKSGREFDAVMHAYVNKIPIGRLIKPKEVGAAVAYLSSPEAAAITGLALPISGAET